jgi:transcriptional regulator with XRE-family HTH domain
MAVTGHEDPSMARVRGWLEKSGLTLHELGLRMGYDEQTARKAVWQFLRTGDPRIGTLRKFAEAAGIPLEELVAPAKPAKRGRRGAP